MAGAALAGGGLIPERPPSSPAVVAAVSGSGTTRRSRRLRRELKGWFRPEARPGAVASPNAVELHDVSTCAVCGTRNDRSVTPDVRASIGYHKTRSKPIQKTRRTPFVKTAMFSMFVHADYSHTNNI